jgi:ADP-ribose pyrophosphatase YjhB (NUDIX family)
MKFCSECGALLRHMIPAGDNKLRYVCESCNIVHYQNPRLIVGCLPRWENKILLCKRTIEPKSGFWTLPAGFLENNETAEAGALRETLEEANAEVRIGRLLSIYSIAAIGQVHLFFLADLKNLNFRPGVETESTALFDETEIPWDRIAFTSVRFTLEQYLAEGGKPSDKTYIGSYDSAFV